MALVDRKLSGIVTDKLPEKVYPIALLQIVSNLKTEEYAKAGIL